MTPPSLRSPSQLLPRLERIGIAAQPKAFPSEPLRCEDDGTQVQPNAVPLDGSLPDFPPTRSPIELRSPPIHYDSPTMSAPHAAASRPRRPRRSGDDRTFHRRRGIRMAQDRGIAPAIRASNFWGVAPRGLGAGGCLALLILFSFSAGAESLLDQRQLLYSTNAKPLHGINWAPQPPAKLPDIAAQASPKQFRGAVVFGAVTRQTKTINAITGTFSDNIVLLGWPHSERGGIVQTILRAAVGGPYLSQGYDYHFGQELIPPETNGSWYLEPLVVVTNGTTVEAAPDHPGASYYWSAHAQKAYANKPGSMEVVWRKRLPESPQPTGAGIKGGDTRLQIGGLWYELKRERKMVSGIPATPARNLYWTKGSYKGSGKPVAVPPGVKQVQIVYNDQIPESVPVSEVVKGADIYGDPGAEGIEAGTLAANTATVAFESGFITAYNREGRVLVELLGEATGPQTRRQLGIEIVEVQRDPIPNDVQIQLGERVTAYQNDPTADSQLHPSPQTQQGPAFAYQRSLNAAGDIELYATRVTQHLSDYQVLWMEDGAAGLRWPYRLVRYAFVWPTEVSKYSHYVRTVVPDEATARLTAIPLPGENSPVLEDQDPSTVNTPRARLTEDWRFYTYLDSSQPVHRALIRYTVREHVAFERILSWLDTGLTDSTVLASTFAAGLRDGDNKAIFIPSPDFHPWPRRVAETVYVGDRIEPPVNESKELAGYVNMNVGASFNPHAYQDPFQVGFAAASSGAIIPVNAIPGRNELEVWWFRRNAHTELRDEALGFKPTYWPSVIGHYTIKYPRPQHPRYREIVLASNHGSGPLTSLEEQGTLYFVNEPKDAVGFNPNEEHALLQGGRVWALRDDLNVTVTENYSSEPFALLEYQDAQGRPSMSAFRIVRETAEFKFDYPVAAGTILQPPMPLPLLDKPFPPTGPSQIPHALNEESGTRVVSEITDTGTADGPTVQIELTRKPAFSERDTLVLSQTAGGFRRYFYLGRTNFRLKTVTGLLLSNLPVEIPQNSDDSPPRLAPSRRRYPIKDEHIPKLAIASEVWVHFFQKFPGSQGGEFHNAKGTITGLSKSVLPSGANSADGYVEIEFGDDISTVIKAESNDWELRETLYADDSIPATELVPLSKAEPAPADFPTHLRFGLPKETIEKSFKHGDVVVVQNSVEGRSWLTHVAGYSLSPEDPGPYLELDFGDIWEPHSVKDIRTANLLLAKPVSTADLTKENGVDLSAKFLLSLDTSEAQPSTGQNEYEEALSQFHAQVSFQDRKGNLWIYRGPAAGNEPVKTSFQFYYKTLPGFWFPTDAKGKVLGTTEDLSQQPEVGTISPYLRPIVTGDARSFEGDAVFGYDRAKLTRQNTLEANDNSLPILFSARWPNSPPVLHMAETLTVPKHGLPAVRGQSSLEVLYQQSAHSERDHISVLLYDPTAAKKFPLADTDPDGTSSALNRIPDSIQTSSYRGKTFFPRLPPHLANRFYLDPNDTLNGSLVLIGEFKEEGFGESYLQGNYLSPADVLTLQNLCPPEDPLNVFWRNAIEESGFGGLTLDFETFYPNPAKPGTFTSTILVGGRAAHQSVEVHATELANVAHSDTAVDSYALTAVGPGTGYVTLIAGQGLAFTKPEEPVSMMVIKVVGDLYRGEVKPVVSSNPLAEQVTLQQVVDLAGKTDDYEFEWWMAAPVDGKPPAVYENTPINLFTIDNARPWRHLAFPVGTDTPSALGHGGSSSGTSRLTTEASDVVIPLSGIAFQKAKSQEGRLVLEVSSELVRSLAPGVPLLVRDIQGNELPGEVESITTANSLITIAPTTEAGLPAAERVLLVQEGALAGQAQSFLYRDFSVPTEAVLSSFYLSLDLDDSLGVQVYVDGQLAVSANRPSGDTATVSAPTDFGATLLPRVYPLGPQYFTGGTVQGGVITHRVLVALYSVATANTPLRFDCRVDAYQSADRVDVQGSQWIRQDSKKIPDKVRMIIGGSADVRALSDNYVISRYRADANNPKYPAASRKWSQWTDPVLVEGWIKRVLAGINPFNQRTTDLFNNTVNADANILTSAGKRWEGDVALNQDSLNDYGLIEIYETVLRRGKGLSIDAGIDYDPANDALLLAAGYLSDLYMMLGNEARSDAANPTIGIGTKDKTYGDVATALFAFKGQLPSLLEEELALLRGRDDFLQPGVRLAPVYNRLVWNYTRGIDSGEVIYALNYNILDQNRDGRVDPTDAAKLYPQGHGDAYGHYLTALKGYYALLIDKDFSWVPRSESVNILGKPVAVDYQDERKFAAAALAVARTGRQVFDLTWKRDYQAGRDTGWNHFSGTRANTSLVPPTQREWGMDHWAARTSSGAYLHWAVANSILPAVDPNPEHEGIQKVDRTTVPELQELAGIGTDLQVAMDNAEGGLTPLSLADGSLAFDLNPNQIAGSDPKSHFDQIYERALRALNNAVVSFDDAKDVTRLMRSEQDSLSELQSSITQQELAYTSALIDLYGTPYPDDVGPGKLYKQGYAGPDLFHYRYVETETIEAPGVYVPNDPEYVAKIDIQQLNANWSYIDNPPRADLSTNGPVDGTASDLVIVNINDPKYEETDPVTGEKLYYIPYAFGSHGFFDKPKDWTSTRQSPGRIQQAISEVIQAHDRMYYALAAQCESDKQDLDKAVQLFKAQYEAFAKTKELEGEIKDTQHSIDDRQSVYDTVHQFTEIAVSALEEYKTLLLTSIPKDVIVGTSVSPGDTTAAAFAPAVYGFSSAISYGIQLADAAGFAYVSRTNVNALETLMAKANEIADLDRQQQLKAAIVDLGAKLKGVQGDFQVINEKLRILDDAKRRYAALVAEGQRIQDEREVFRQRVAALVQGFRTRDAAFRIFRNEKLERYKSLFDLAARYAYLAANAYDYETGLLNTPKGRDFVSRIVNARALGVVKSGEPQFAGSNLGDPGLSSVLAEMKADWDVLKGRLGFNNPAAYGTTFSLRTEKFRILPGADGADAWKNVLNRATRANLLEDPDVLRYCMQIDPGNGLPLPGFVLEFETTIADGLNFFGETQQAWDHYFDSSAFATKIFAAGVALEGYVGMDSPAANSGAVGAAGGVSPADPSLAFLDPNGLGATPGVYLIPVGLDSMRSPALGDAGTVRTWEVQDVTIPLPFNIGDSDFSTKPLYQTSDSLSEPLFGLRKHASFRPVPTTSAFSSAIYGNGGVLQRSQYTNSRLIGRSVWNSRWKLVIPGHKLLHDPEEAIRRFVKTVSDIKLHFVTYSYSGN